MFKAFWKPLASTCFVASALLGQDPAGSAAQATQRITGAIVAADTAAHTVQVKEDKTGTVYKVDLENTKSLRKVDPATLDLKQAVRITPDDLIVGDRVQVFASKSEEHSDEVTARALILISARDLQNVHQEQAAAWQHSTGGVVTQVDSTAAKVSIAARTPQGPKPMVVDVAKAQFTRYAPENPKVPAPSQLADVHVGDQLRVIGETGADGSTITAERVYSSGMRMIVCTVNAVSPDGKLITVKDLQTKQPVLVALNDDSAVRKLPPMMAMALARRLNPAANGGAGGSGQPAGGSPGSPQNGAKQGEASLAPNGAWKGGAAAGSEAAAGAGGTGGPAGGGSGGFRAGGGMRNGDVSQLLERVPKISATDLKPGDAVMVAGTPVNNDKARLLATNVIAGVEPIFQAASPRQMQSLGDWGLSSGAGAMDGMPPQ